MHKVAKIAIGIGTLGLIISLLLFGLSARQLSNSQDNVDWNDWIVYEVEGNEASLYLDEDIGYTIYVDNSYECGKVDAEASYKGTDYYEENCDPYFDFDNWMQIGDIVNEYSGEHQIAVSVDRFILVDWTTVQGDSFENTLVGVFGCCFSIGVLIVGAILALVLRDGGGPGIGQGVPINTDGSRVILQQDSSEQDSGSDLWYKSNDGTK